MGYIFLYRSKKKIINEHKLICNDIMLNDDNVNNGLENTDNQSHSYSKYDDNNKVSIADELTCTT
jgi:hypothetical protein